MAGEGDAVGDAERVCQRLQRSAFGAVAEDRQRLPRLHRLGEGAQHQREMLLGDHPPDRDEAARTRRPRCARRHQLGRADRGIVDYMAPRRHHRRQLGRHRFVHHHPAARAPRLDAQPCAPEEAADGVEIAPGEIVAHLDDDRRAAAAKHQPHREGDDGVGGAGNEQHIGAQPADHGRQREDHPQRLPAGLAAARLARHQIIDVTEFLAHRAIRAAEKQRRIHAHRSPMPHQTQCNPLHAARMEAVKEGENAQASAAIGWRQSLVLCHRCDFVSPVCTLFFRSGSRSHPGCDRTFHRFAYYFTTEACIG